MRYLLCIVLLTTFSYCKRDAYITKNEVENLLGLRNIQVKKRLAFNINESKQLENIVRYTTENKEAEVGLFSKNEGSYHLLGRIQFAEGEKLKKLMFINAAKSYSHLLLLKQLVDREYSLALYDGATLLQNIPLKAADLKNLFIKKNESRPRDEMLNVGEALYRFDSFEYIETFIDKPLFYLAQFSPQGENSIIEMVNRGGYTARAVVTISFVDLTGANYKEQVRLVKDIKTVTLYRPGQSVFKNGGGRVRLAGPSIEIIKEPFASVGHGRLKLPLFLGEKPGKILIRAVYKYRGRTYQWPEAPTGARAEKDQQGFWAYRLN